MNDERVPPAPCREKGRGAVSSSASGRFGLPLTQVDGDWLDERDAIDGAPRPSETEVTIEHPKSILTFNQSPDIPFDRSVNAYRGCEHGCIYCFARPTHAYHDLSPGLDFERRLFAKPNAAELLRATLAKPSYVCAPIAIGTNTDPYQPIEKRFGITRAILQLMVETRHPIGITTKSDRILHDIDLLTELADQGLTAVMISLTSLDPNTARLMEPRAPAPTRRLAAIEQQAEADLPVHAFIAPVVPAITDHEIEALVAAAANAGANVVGYIHIRLPHEVAPLFEEWLDTHFPDRKAKVMATIRSLRGGKKNDPNFFSRMRGTGVWADLIAQRMAIASRRHGLEKRDWALRTDLFRRPVVKGSQLELGL